MRIFWQLMNRSFIPSCVNLCCNYSIQTGQLATGRQLHLEAKGPGYYRIANDSGRCRRGRRHHPHSGSNRSDCRAHNGDSPSPNSRSHCSPSEWLVGEFFCFLFFPNRSKVYFRASHVIKNCNIIHTRTHTQKLKNWKVPSILCPPFLNTVLFYSCFNSSNANNNGFGFEKKKKKDEVVLAVVL